MLSIGYICKNSSNNNSSSSSTTAEKQTTRKKNIQTYTNISILKKNDHVRLLKTHGCCSLFPFIIVRISVWVSFLFVCPKGQSQALLDIVAAADDVAVVIYFSCTVHTVHSSHVDFPIGYVVFFFSIKFLIFTHSVTLLVCLNLA